MEVVPLRLQPGDDLREALEAWMGEQQEQAGCLISAVGSLSVAQLRLAGAREATGFRGELEIALLPEWRFRRGLDPATGFAELEISRNGPPSSELRQPLWGPRVSRSRLGSSFCFGSIRMQPQDLAP